MNSEPTAVPPPLPPNVFDALPDLVKHYIRSHEALAQHLQMQIYVLQTQICALTAQVQHLTAQLSKNSSNSSKPPSSDGLKGGTKSQRERSGKKPGGQLGHIGKTLSPVDNPDHIEHHTPTTCHGCGSGLEAVQGVCVETRQVFDIPQPCVEVTEHHLEEKICPCCGKTNRAQFPEHVRGHVQYGHRLQALVVYFAHQHLIPVERVGQILEDIFGVGVSPGTCANIDEKLFNHLESFEAHLREYLLAMLALHFDETGMRCEKKLQWIHVAASQMATLYFLHNKRGKEAMDQMGILPHFHGKAVHDHWAPYFSYELVHGLCNAHHLRELTFVYEEEKEEWAKQMKELLISAKNAVEAHQEEGCLPEALISQIEQNYTQIITEAIAYHEKLPPLPQGKRGRRKQRNGKNFLDRLQKNRDSVLLFMHDFSVPFTNNQGEQDIRMVKLKQKIGGCFRTFRGGQIFCRIRSYISTARKQSWNIWDALVDAVKGQPRHPEPISLSREAVA